jgi:hypothetical protein
MTIPEIYPDLARLLSEYFSRELAREGALYQDAVLAFVLTESHETLLRTKSDARTILESESELRALESFLAEKGFDFGQLGPGVTARDWLSDVITLISTSL